MEKIRIHEDQENHVFDGRQKQSVMAGPQKRAVLGLIDQNKAFSNAQGFKTKQPLGISNQNVNLKNLKGEIKTKQPLKNFQDENIQYFKENHKNLVNPIVPVAQFEAFKVYEDVREEQVVCIEQKLKAKSTCTIYKGTSEDRFYTKTEVAKMEKVAVSESLYETRKLEDEERPMSIEKSFSNSMQLADEVIYKNARSKDQFFELEEYRCDIYQYLREHEMRNRAKPGYMKKQPDVSSTMRTILVDWLVEVAEEYKLQTETLYLAVNYIDRFLSYMSVVRAKLQLVGTSAMFLASETIAESYLLKISKKAAEAALCLKGNDARSFITQRISLAFQRDNSASELETIPVDPDMVQLSELWGIKYEEIFPPDISEFVYITDDTYNKRQVIRMEHLILKVLGFDLSVPTPLTFITAICSTNKITEKAMYLAMYLCELSLLNGEVYLEFLPSTLAASAITIARHTLGEEAWNEELKKSTGYELNQLRPCVEFLLSMFTIAPTYPQHAIQDKYKSSKYMHVSQLTPNDKPIFIVT